MQLELYNVFFFLLFYYYLLSSTSWGKKMAQDKNICRLSGDWLSSFFGGLEGTKFEDLRKEGLGKKYANRSEMKRNPIPSSSFHH